MLDEKKLILLREASEISGYSADYIGQLIREGKIPGKQVCYTVAWMTTAEAVLEYKKRSKRKGAVKKSSAIKDFFLKIKQRILIEFNILQLFFKTFKASLPVFIVLILSFFFLIFSLFYYYFDQNSVNRAVNLEKNQEKEISF